MITGIGSIPFTDVDEAIDLIFESCYEIPFWPQLPKRTWKENMYTTFLEGLPCLVIDEAKNMAYIDTESTDKIEEFYTNVYDENIDFFKISPDVAPGFYRLLERLNEIREGVRFIKGQLTGPFSVGLGLKDKDGRSILYNPSLFDMVKNCLRMKALWMVRTIKGSYPEKDVIIFFDEPYLVSFGSAYIAASKGEVITMLDEVTGGIDAKRGVHCCGNTDWSVLLNTTLDIINYDAYGYLETIFYFEDDLKGFFSKGGWVSPGIVPSSKDVISHTVDDIKRGFRNFLDLAERVYNNINKREWLITTSCGLGTLEPVEARRAMELLKALSDLPY